MIEPIMYFGIGFLFAALIGLVIVPLVHARAVRLTIRRLEAATPVSLAEIQADKDQLRAEFAMSTRRLEMNIEELKAKSTHQQAELGKKSDAVNRLKLELGEKTASILALEAREKALRDQLRTTEEDLTTKTSAVLEIQQTLSEQKTELSRTAHRLQEEVILAESQKIEIIALKSQKEALEQWLEKASSDLKSVEDRRDAERVELKTVTHELLQEREKVETLLRRKNELEQLLIAQSEEAEILVTRAQELETRLDEQARLLNETETERKRLRHDLKIASTTENELRAVAATLESSSTLIHQQLKSENAQLKAELARARDDRNKSIQEHARLKREAEENWADEQVENTFLRDRINDVAEKIARLVSTLEGPKSTLAAILAAETIPDTSITPPSAPRTNVGLAGSVPTDKAANRASRTTVQAPSGATKMPS